MNVHHTLICFFFFTVLQDGNIGLINAEIPIFRGTEGQSITVPCNFKETGSKKYFCKDECEENILESSGDDDECQPILKIDDDSARSGRYSMRYETTREGSRLDVTITHLTKSDSGVYSCVLDKCFTDPYQQFEIIVTDGSLMYVRLTLVIIAVLLFSVAVLILCKKRASKPKEHPEETECVNVTEASPVYEEIREGDGQSRSPPVEKSVEASAVYSLVTATASRPLSKTEDDLNELDYTEVDLSNRAAASLSSAPSGQVDKVIYSTPQKHTDAKVESQPLYSTITLPQQ
ncbi:uncharacterized protein LOC133987936 isoform X2 [Scomber scombrus]|uniref:uncharacterized protein LOC133987936 isoform X2 n=1 Tax=Scomber scombrus TaxID=13677 RepID=UPI002DD87D39|nr:uncharacterized protein LOC133987936 isoform X2 [Scomber scombrus]